jgi:RHS repeat-associated protein
LIQNSSGAWEYRQWDPLRRPTSLQNEAGFHQTLRYQLNNIRSLESRTDQGKRQSVETYFADARQNMRLGALSGPNEGQTRLVGWTKLSRRGMPLLSGSPMLVTDPGNPISIIRKNLNLVPTGSHFRSYDALERLTSESLDQNQESLKVMYHAWGLTLGTLDYKDQPVDTIEVRRLDNVTTMIQDSTNQKHFFGRNIRGAMESVLLSGEEKPRRYLSYGGRLLAESQIPGIRRTSYHYDESLLVKEQHVRDGHDQLAATLHYEYDVQKRLREVRNQDKQLVSAYTYQADSLETAIQSDPKQALIVKRTYERDEEGRILHEKVLYTDHAGKILHQGEESYAYTEDGLLSQRINPFSVRFDYAYSPDRTLRSLHMTQGNRKVELFQASAYDALGLLHEAHYADGNLIAQWDHDPITTMEQGSRLCQARDGRCLSTWDENLLRSRSGLMVERTRQHPEGEDFESFSYSPRNEILFGDLNGASENFSYNSFGGSEPKDSGAPLPSPLPPQGQHRIYDQLGRLQKTQTIHDIVYSEVDRPLSIRKDAATIDLGYDAAGQLSYRGQNTDGLVAPLYLPFTDSVSSPEDDLQTLVLPGSMQVKFSHKKEALTWQWLDAQGTPLMTLDATGNFLRRHQRQIYGKRLDSQTENLEVLPIDFAGQRLDSETGFVYFGDRWFDTVEGRFITPDALAMDQPTLCLAAQWMDCNLYSYRSNNPLAQ